MTRSLLFFAVVTCPLLIWPAPASAQMRRCPFNPQAQIQVQMQWQQQQRMQQTMQMQRRTVMTQQPMRPRMAVPPMQRMPNMPQMRTNTNMQRNTQMVRQVQSVTTFSRRTITSAAIRPAMPRIGVGTGGRPAMPVTAVTQQLRRSTTQRVTMQPRQAVTRQTAVSMIRPARPAGTLRTPAGQLARTAPRARQVTSIARQLTPVTEHRAVTQVRMRMGMTCGSCHDCTQNRTMNRIPNRVPFAVNQPIVRRPTIQQNLLRQNLITQRPIQRIPIPVLVRQVQPMPIPVLRPPVLPPLTLTARTGTPQLLTIESFLVGKPVRSTPSITTLRTTQKKPTRSPGETIQEESSQLRNPLALTGEPPPLPSLGEMRAALSPALVAEKKPELRPSAAISRDELSPTEVTNRPTLLPLGKATLSDRQLLPNLDGSEEFVPVTPANPLELVRQAPPLPPLPMPN